MRPVPWINERRNKTLLMALFQVVKKVTLEVDRHQVIKSFKRQQILICGAERLAWMFSLSCGVRGGKRAVWMSMNLAVGQAEQVKQYGLLSLPAQSVSPHSEGPVDALVHPAGCRSDSIWQHLTAWFTTWIYISHWSLLALIQGDLQWAQQ